MNCEECNKDIGEDMWFARDETIMCEECFKKDIPEEEFDDSVALYVLMVLFTMGATITVVKDFI